VEGERDRQTIITKALRGQTQYLVPEHQLVVAVVGQAIVKPVRMVDRVVEQDQTQVFLEDQETRAVFRHQKETMVRQRQTLAGQVVEGALMQ
jgi:hypothetical protein